MTAPLVKSAFEPKLVEVPIAEIVLLRQTPDRAKLKRKYRQIVASVQEVGIIEPPVVTRMRGRQAGYLLLDGHLRIEVLKGLGHTSVSCLVSTDDEAYTYNKRINRLATVQEHKMILRAIERGVSEARIARALDVDVAHIKKKRRLLDGICDEAAELLKDKHCPIGTFDILKRMAAVRQIEVAELMVSAGIFTITYAKALLAATPQDQLSAPEKRKTITGLSPEQVAKMESEMVHVQRAYRVVEKTYGEDVLNLTLARGYVERLLSCTRIARFLEKNYADLLKEFQVIINLTSLEPKKAASAGF